jgi:hypothetical protein
MALLLYEGFDNWSSSFITASNLSGVTGTAGVGIWTLVPNGTIFFLSSPYGGKYMNLHNTSSFNYSLSTASTNTLICGFRVNTTDLATNILTIYDSAAAVQCGLGISATKLFMWRGTTATVLGTGNTTLAVNRDYFIEIKTQLSNSANVTVRINGIVEFTLSGVDTTNTANQNWMLVGVSTTPGGADVNYDDLYLSDDTGPAPYNDFLGPVHVDTSFVTASTRSQFTPLTSTNVSQVSETAIDGDTTYNFGSNTTGAVDLFNHLSFLAPPAAALASTPQTVFATKVQSYARRDDVQPILYRNKLVSSTGLITNGAVRGLGGLTTVYQLQEDYYTTDPATGLAWTAAGVNGSQIGYEILRSSLLYFLGVGSLTVNATTSNDGFAKLDGTATNVTLTNNLRTAQHTNSSSNSGARSTSLKNSGKLVFEVQLSNITGQFSSIGILTAAGTLTNFVTDGFFCAAAYFTTGQIWSNGAFSGKVIAGYTGTDFVMVAVDFAALKVWFRVATTGLWNNGAIGAEDPANNLGGVSISNFSATTMGPAVGFGGSGTSAGETWLANFGNAAFTNPVPSGFTAGWPL